MSDRLPSACRQPSWSDADSHGRRPTSEQAEASPNHTTWSIMTPCRASNSIRICARASAISARRFPTATGASSTRARAYPDAFVKALTDAGYLAALIPEEYGGSGLGIAEAVDHPRGDQPQRRQRRRLPRADVHDGHAAAARLRRAEARVPAEDRERRAAPAGVRRQRADDRLRHDAAEDDRDAQGRPLRHPRPEDLDLARRALRPAAARRPHDADRAGEEAHRRPVDPARRPAAGRRPRPDDPSDPHDDEPCDDGAVLRRSRGAGRRRWSARKARASAI